MPPAKRGLSKSASRLNSELGVCVVAIPEAGVDTRLKAHVMSDRFWDIFSLEMTKLQTHAQPKLRTNAHMCKLSSPSFSALVPS